MECSEPGIIRDEEMLAYLSGERVRPVVGQHLTSCAHCSARLASYRRMEHVLTSKLYRWDCPPSQVLGEYQLGLLSAEVAAAVKLHMSTCVLCVAEVATLSEFLVGDPMLVERAAVSRGSVQPSSLENHRSVPQETKRVLDGLIEQAHTQVRRVIATLLPPPPRLAYQRNLAQPELWPRRYTAEDVNVSLQVERDVRGPGAGRNDSLQLIGFVTRKGMALEGLQGIQVQLSSEADAVYTQHIDELGNFVFASIVPATYKLELEFPESVIVIEQIPIHSQSS